MAYNKAEKSDSPMKRRGGRRRKRRERYIERACCRAGRAGSAIFAPEGGIIAGSRCWRNTTSSADRIGTCRKNTA